MSDPADSIFTLADVLTEDELAAQPWPSDMVLIDRRTVWPEIWEGFARMPQGEKRAYVQQALAISTLSDSHPAWRVNWPLVQAYAPPPRWTPHS